MSSLTLKVLGHRGAILPHAPFWQNSLAAFGEALAVCDGLETDACRSRDGEVFLIHEAKYASPEKGVEYCAAEQMEEASAARLGARRIGELESAQIRTLRLKDGAPIPSLRDLCRLARSYPSALLNLELKGHGVAPDVVRIVREEEIPAERLLLSSFNHPALEEVRGIAPGIALGALFVDPTVPPAMLYPWVPGSGGMYQPLTPDALASPLLQRVKPEWIIMPDTALTPENLVNVDKAHPQAKVAAWWFTEREGDDPDSLVHTAKALLPGGKLGALIVDNPRRYAPLLNADGA